MVEDLSRERFASYVSGLVEEIGHADRADPLRDYCLGLLMPGERKSVEPMAAVTAPARVSAQHQSLLHFVANAPWSDERVLAGYGTDTGLRTAITALGLPYVAGIQSTATLWPPGKGPLPPKPWSGRGRPTTRTLREAEHQPVQAKALALGLPAAAQ